MRSRQIQEEYDSTNYAAANIQQAQSSSSKGKGTSIAGTRPDDWLDEPYNLRPGHEGHMKGECSVRKLRALRRKNQAKPPMVDAWGCAICDYVAISIKCPFTKGCSYSHRLKGTKPAPPNSSSKSNNHHTARMYAAATADGGSDTDDSRRSRRSRRSEKSKHRRKHKHKKRKSRRKRYDTSSSSGSSSESSDFI